MRSSAQQLDIFGGPDAGAMLRDIGMIEAEFAEALTGSDFAEVAYAAICHVARRQSELHVDDILKFCTVKPSHYNAWGAVYMRAIKDGVIINTGRVRQCLSDPLKRRHSSPIYRSGIFHRRRG